MPIRIDTPTESQVDHALKTPNRMDQDDARRIHIAVHVPRTTHVLQPRRPLPPHRYCLPLGVISVNTRLGPE